MLVSAHHFFRSQQLGDSFFGDRYLSFSFSRSAACTRCCCSASIRQEEIERERERERERRERREREKSSVAILAQVDIWRLVLCHFEPLLFLALFFIVLPWTRCDFRNRPLSRRFFFISANRAQLQMSPSWIS